MAVLRSLRETVTDAAPFGSIALVAAALLAFAGLAVEMGEGETLSFDRAILLALRDPANTSVPIGPRWLTEVARDVTSLGSTAGGNRHDAGRGRLSSAGEQENTGRLRRLCGRRRRNPEPIVKLGFQRPRPNFAPYGPGLQPDSFPSGHAMLSAVTCLTLGALLAQPQARWTMRAYVMGLSISTTLLVGFSRIYLGVHWPTDVLAGWCLGSS